MRERDRASTTAQARCLSLLPTSQLSYNISIMRNECGLLSKSWFTCDVTLIDGWGLRSNFPSPDIGECQHNGRFVILFRADVPDPLFTWDCRQFLIAEARVQSQGSINGICGRQTISKTSFWAGRMGPLAAHWRLALWNLTPRMIKR
jgi:hypothetical protein